MASDPSSASWSEYPETVLPRRNAACREAAAMAYGAVMGGMVPKTDRGNSHLDGSLRVIRLRRPLYGTSMPGAGAVHHIKDRPLAPCCMSAFAGCGHGASHALGGNGRTAWAKSCLSRCKKDQVKARHPAPTAMGCRLMRRREFITGTFCGFGPLMNLARRD